MGKPSGNIIERDVFKSSGDSIQQGINRTGFYFGGIPKTV